jgi:hypothetical protein
MNGPRLLAAAWPFCSYSPQAAFWPTQGAFWATRWSVGARFRIIAVEKLMTSRKKPGVAFWATVVAVVVLAYYLSLGPVFWLVNTIWPGKAAMPHWALPPFSIL